MKDLRFDVANGRAVCVPCHGLYGARVWMGEITRAAFSPAAQRGEWADLTHYREGIES